MAWAGELLVWWLVATAGSGTLLALVTGAQAGRERLRRAARRTRPLRRARAVRRRPAA